MSNFENGRTRRILLWALLTAAALVCLLVDITYFDDLVVKICLGIALILLTVLCAVQLGRAAVVKR
jgi:hypothetical protein